MTDVRVLVICAIIVLCVMMNSLPQAKRTIFLSADNITNRQLLPGGHASEGTAACCCQLPSPTRHAHLVLMMESASSYGSKEDILSSDNMLIE